MSVKIKKIVFNLLIVFLSVVFTLIFAEMGLRIYYFQSLDTPRFYYLTPLLNAHPLYGWIYSPNLKVNLQTFDYAVEFKTNSRGFHDIEYNYKKDPGIFRIVVLGDSFMDAYQVNFKDSLTQLLCKRLENRKVEVINLGIRAYGTVQQLLLLKNEGLKYNPDLVILGFFPLNDIYDNSPRLNNLLWGEQAWQFFSRPFFYRNSQESEPSFEFPDFEKCSDFFKKKQTVMRDKLKERNFFEKTVLFRLIELYKQLKNSDPSISPYDPNITFGAFLKKFAPNIYPKSNMTIKKYESFWQEAWETTYTLIIQIQRTLQLSGSDFILLNIPAKIQVEKKYFGLVKEQLPDLVFDLEKINRKLKKFSETHKIKYLDLLPYFQNYSKNHNGMLYHRRIDRHWNEKGHKLAAEILLNYLDIIKIIPK